MGMRPEDLHAGIEVAPAERPRITPDDLLRDGQSEEARRFSATWVGFHRARDLTAVVSCSDAREFYCPEPGVFVFKAIAASVPDQLISPAGILSGNFGTRRVVVMGHHAGSSVLPRKRPEGCGGKAAKARMRLSGNEGRIDAGEGSTRFVERRIVHEDPIVTAYFDAYRVAEGAGVPALGVTQDHETGKLSVLMAAVPTSRGIEVISDITLSKILDGQYREEELYENGIPALGEDRIPDEFQPFLIRHADYAAAMRRSHPDFARSQRIQDPGIVLFTSVIRPTRGRLPEIAGSTANRIFAITVPRDLTVSSIDVSFQGLQDASDELHYPLTQAALSQGNKEMPFSSLYAGGTVIFETKHMEHSKALATGLLLEKPWFREWAERDGNRIIVAETTKGLVQKAEYF